MLARRITLLLCCVASLTACGATAASDASVPATLPIGELPSSLPPDPNAPAGTLRPTTTLPRADQIGAIAPGNRVIVIGDSVVASTSKRYSNDMCKALVPLGWQVELDAETGRFVEFGAKVLDQRLSAGWDASVILLGNNYIQNQDGYRQQLDRLVRRLSPDPVVLLTVTEFVSTRRAVNAVIREMADKYPNVTIVDWATTTAEDRTLTGGDGLHLTPSGRKALAANVALALGEAPEQPGKCLTTKFTDDSMMPVTGTSAPGTRNTSTTSQTGPSDTSSPSSSLDTTAAITPTTKKKNGP